MPTLVARGDARAIPLNNSVVDCVITSPPYFGLRSYTDGGVKGYTKQIGVEATPQEYVAELISCTREMSRVLKHRGSMFVNLGDTYAAYNANRGDGKLQRNKHRPTFVRGLSGGGMVPNKSLMLIPERYRIACVDELRLTVRSVIIWAKPNPMPGGRLRDRVLTTHEDWVHLTKTDRYYHDESALRELGAGQMPASVQRIPVPAALSVPDHIAHKRCCGNTRNARCVDGLTHCATFPLAWPKLLISGWCPVGGVVLDPFGGSGTTALAAKQTHRIGVSLDLSMDYGKIAQWRLAAVS